MKAIYSEPKRNALYNECDQEHAKTNDILHKKC